VPIYLINVKIDFLYLSPTWKFASVSQPSKYWD